nr:helix-turn-helix domain-containing protein [Sulfurimonas sediminis]
MVEASNTDKKPDIDRLTEIFSEIRDKKERNSQIVKTYKEGYSQHMIAKVLGISQQAVCGIIKRSGK